MVVRARKAGIERAFLPQGMVWSGQNTGARLECDRLDGDEAQLIGMAPLSGPS